MKIKLLAIFVIVAILINALPALAQKPTPPPTPAPAPTDKPPPPPTEPPPTEAPAKPTALPTPVPTKPPALPTPTQKPTALSTPVPTKPPAPLTPTSKPTVLPTPTSVGKPSAPPTPTGSGSAPGQPTGLPGQPTLQATSQLPVSPTQGITAMTAPGVAVMAVLTGSQTIAGRVFDDRNGNGKQDANEPGVAGVPVVINGQVVAATDAGGRFTVPVIEGASLSIVPPAGWQWIGDPLPADAPGNAYIPLRQQATPAAQVAAVTTGVASGLILVVLGGLLLFNLLASLSQATAVRSLEKTYRRQKSQELELRMARELTEHRERLDQRLQASPDAWREILAQLLADVGLNMSSGYAQEISVFPCPHFSVPGEDGRLYMFATDPDRFNSRRWQERFFRRDRVIPLDASLSHYARVDAQALWNYLIKTHPEVYDTAAHPPVLPSDATWYLVVTTPRQVSIRRGRAKK